MPISWACSGPSPLSPGAEDISSTDDDFSCFLAFVKKSSLDPRVKETHQQCLEKLTQRLDLESQQLANVGGDPNLMSLEYHQHWKHRVAALATLDSQLMDVALEHDSLAGFCYMDPLTLLYRKTFYGRTLREVAGKRVRLMLAAADLGRFHSVGGGWWREYSNFPVIIAAQSIGQEMRLWNELHEKSHDGHCIAFRFGGDQFVFAFVFPAAGDGLAEEAAKAAAMEMLQRVQRRVTKDIHESFGWKDLQGRKNLSGPAISIGASVPAECCGCSATDFDRISQLHQLYALAEMALEQSKGSDADPGTPEQGIPMLGEGEAAQIRKQVALLTHGDTEQQQAAARALWAATAREENRAAIINAGASRPLVKLLTSGSPEAQEAAAGVLQNASNCTAHNVAMVRAGALPPLVQILQQGGQVARENAAAVVCNLSRDELTEAAVFKAGVVLPLIKLLEHGSPAAQEHAAAALQNLCVAGGQQKLRLVEEGALKPLVRLMEVGTDGAKGNAAGALRNLAVHREIQPMIVQAKALKPLAKLLSHRSEAVREKALAAIQNLSLHENNREAIVEAGCLGPIVTFLENGTDGQKELAAVALWWLSINDEPKVRIVEAGALRPLVQLIDVGGDSAKEKAVGALRNLAVDKDNQVEIVKANAVGPLLGLLNTGSDAAIECAAAALANLSFHAENRTKLLEAGALASLENFQAACAETGSRGQASKFAGDALRMLGQRSPERRRPAS